MRNVTLQDWPADLQDLIDMKLTTYAPTVREHKAAYIEFKTYG